MRFLLLLLCLSTGGLVVQGQDDVRVHEDHPRVPRYSLKLGIWPLMNIGKMSLDLGADWRVSERFSLDLEAGPYLYSHNFASEKNESYQGLRLRPGFKWDVGGINLGLMFQFEWVRNKTYRLVFRQGASYTQDYLMDRSVSIQGLHFRMERAFVLSSDRRWILEPFLRFGFQNIFVAYDLPRDAEIVDDFALIQLDYKEGRSVRPYFYMGMNLGMAWWK